MSDLKKELQKLSFDEYTEGEVTPWEEYYMDQFYEMEIAQCGRCGCGGCRGGCSRRCGGCGEFFRRCGGCGGCGCGGCSTFSP